MNERTTKLNKNRGTNATKYSAKLANPKQEQQGLTVKQRIKKPKERQGRPEVALDL